MARLTTLRPISDLTYDDGPVLCWYVGPNGNEGEPPVVGSLDESVPPWEWDHDAPCWRWSPLPKVVKP